MSEDTELRDLCTRFLDAIERRRIDIVGDIFASDLAFWANFTNQTKSREEMLEAISAGYSVHRRRMYNDRHIRTFDGGFVAQYTCAITRLDGSRSAYWAAMVAQVRGGRIVRIDEYMDSGKFPKMPAASPAA